MGLFDENVLFYFLFFVKDAPVNERLLSLTLFCFIQSQSNSFDNSNYCIYLTNAKKAILHKTQDINRTVIVRLCLLL